MALRFKNLLPLSVMVIMSLALMVSPSHSARAVSEENPSAIVPEAGGDISDTMNNDQNLANIITLQCAHKISHFCGQQILQRLSTRTRRFLSVTNDCLLKLEEAGPACHNALLLSL